MFSGRDKKTDFLCFSRVIQDGNSGENRENFIGLSNILKLIRFEVKKHFFRSVLLDGP